MTLDQKKIESAAKVMTKRRPTVVLTGAGVSVESGIPDFRSSGGLWERFNPMEYATIDAFRGNPRKVWNMLRELEHTLSSAKPNPGHQALADLEAAQVVSAIITQNIDNLHQEAGSKRVVEFHGNGRRLVCLKCPDVSLDAEESKKAVDPKEGVPYCPKCSEILKPDVVLFNEPIPEESLSDSYDLANSCGVMLVAGTSATVMPAATLPLIARRIGAALIEVNIEETELTPNVDMLLKGPSGEVLPALAEAVIAQIAS